MQKEHIIKMANQIGDFFKSYPKQDYAEEQIANHLKKFWSPEMRKFLKNEVDSCSADGLEMIVEIAVKKYL